jgi:hypothetical protein
MNAMNSRARAYLIGWGVYQGFVILKNPKRIGS